MTARELDAQRLQKEWNESGRWKGIKRGYSAEDVVRLRGSTPIEHTLARRGAEKLWRLLGSEAYVNSLGALTGNQALQQVKAGLKAIYLSGWQVAGDANLPARVPGSIALPGELGAGGGQADQQHICPADQIHGMKARIPPRPVTSTTLRRSSLTHEAGFGGVLNAFELMKSMIEAGAAGVHFEDQLRRFKKCGHMGGKVLVPTREAVAKLVAARLAADVCGVPTLLLARTDAEAADLVTSDVDENDAPHLTGERTVEGFFKTKPGLQQAVSRGLAYAPYADLLWCETGKPDLAFAESFAEALHKRFPERCWRTTARAFKLEKESRRFDDRALPERARAMATNSSSLRCRIHSLNYSCSMAHGYARIR